MAIGDILSLLNRWQAPAARTCHAADAPDRAVRLSPEIVTRWTEVVRDAAAAVKPGARRCDYGPWIEAVGQAGVRHGFVPHPDDLVPQTSVASRLRNFIEDVSSPKWPDPRRDLIEFALAVLEADVMLFRSGYAKRHMIRRLQQSPLSEPDVVRIEAMLKRAVLEGTGLEEYRAWGKLAAHLVAEGRLPDLVDWLAPRAEGAILTIGMADAPLWRKLCATGLSDAEWGRLGIGVWRRHYGFGVAWPDLGTVVPAGAAVDSADQRIRRNAWRMLDHIARRRPDIVQEKLANRVA